MNAAQTYWLRRRRSTRPATQSTTAALGDVGDEINTFGKYQGKKVTDLDTLTLYAALGADADSAWRPVGVFDDSADLAPVEPPEPE